MNSRPRRRKRLLLGLALLLCLGLAFGAALLPRWGVSLSFSGVLAPIQQGLSACSEWWARCSSAFAASDALQAENQALKEQVAALNRQLFTKELTVQENQRLRTLLGFSLSRPELALTPGTVLSRGASNWSSVWTADQGTTSGIEPGCCVVTETGALLGVVSETGKTWCAITTVLDPSFTLSGLVLSTGEPAVLEGTVSLMTQNRLRLSYLSASSSLQAGDWIVTAGCSGSYPAGLPVGTVERLEQDASGLAPFAVLIPAADFQSTVQVFFIQLLEPAEQESGRK